MRAAQLAELAGAVHPDTPVDVELVIPPELLAEWGWDVDLDVELERVDVVGRTRLVIVTRTA